jgi:hypothetical protein
MDYNNIMKTIIIILMLIPIYSFSQGKSDTKKICELGISAKDYLIFSSKLKMKMAGLADGYFAYKDGQLDDFEGFPSDLEVKKIEALKVKLYKSKESTLKAISKRNYKEDFFCAINIKDKELSREITHSTSDLVSELPHLINYKNRNIIKCLKSVNPISFVANELDIPSKHIRDYKMLKREIIERFGKEFKNEKICNIESIALDYASFVAPEESTKEKNKQICKYIINYEYDIQKKLHNCSPKT